MYGCVGPWSLCVGFLWLQRAVAAPHRRVQAAPCGGLSLCRARALGTEASVVAACRFSSGDVQAQLLCGM